MSQIRNLSNSGAITFLSAEASKAVTDKPEKNPPPAPKKPTEMSSEDKTKNRPTRVKYPVPEGGLTEWPADWDPRKHLNLGEKDFADATIYIDRQIDILKKRLAALEERKESIKIYGSNPEALAAARKAQAIARRAEALVEDTDGVDGVDAEAILRKAMEAAIARVRAKAAGNSANSASSDEAAS